jgi:predicted metal-dependent hydrolase
MYAIIHELAHMFNKEIGHGDEFIRLNKLLLEQAILAKIYTYKDYSKFPFTYNGIYVN